ncbi:TonB-dependent receptor [Spirosoma sp. BT702]|uniref:TonB-dependent receptor n=1 Tax=Spirosoma profusum TaxID=2771354 RepID=A0A927AT74_9BACT|nr:TonB-dependent receptor [Spirosoma profusum]MBD2699462.1 TonB-dependent receptor [Spirosoma profusum]
MKHALRQAYRTLPLLVLSWLLCVGAFAQDRKITGRVTDGTDNNPLPGANVVITGTSTGMVTDANGQFSLSVPTGRNTLTVSAIGFVAQEVTIGTRSNIDITLSADIKTLNEVVVTGYGAQAKRDITGAVATVDMKEALKVPSANVAQALQGRVAGVTVGNDNSPGGGVMVRIRGFGTINDNSPLYVIDGVPTKGNLNTLNPNDIESLQVLKDASSASIYGSRAGNGVVIITTKKGKAGKPKLTYDAYYGVATPGKFPELVNTTEFANLIWESRRNAGNIVNGNPRHAQFGNGATPVIPDYIFPDGAMEGDPRLAKDASGNFVNYSTDVDAAAFRNSKWLITKANKEGTNWFDEIFDPAPVQNHQIGVTGGNEGGRYAMSANYFSQDGILKYTWYKRYSIRANTEFNVTKRIRVGENIQFAYGERVGGGNSTQSATANNNESNAISMAYRIQPLIPVYDVAGNFAGTKGGDLDNARNPAALLFRNKDNVGKELRFFGNAYAEVDILKNLTAKTSFGIDYNTYNIRAYTPRDIESSEAAGANSMFTRNEIGYTWTWYNTLTYNGEIGSSIRYNLLAGTESIKNNFEFFRADRSRFANDDLYNRYLDAGNAGTQTNTGGGSDWKLASEFAKASFSFFDKYLLDGTIRRDRSSRFAAANRVAYFPAVSAGWRVSQEEFLKTVTWINDLKFRAAYGQTGNQEIGNYNPYLIYGTGPTVSFYDLNGSRTSSLQGYELQQFGNANAKWETTTSVDFGIDASLFKGKLDVTFDWFNRVTSDALFPVEVQYTQGQATNPFQNIASFRNRGIELGLNHSGKLMNGDFTYSIGANISTYRNLVTKTDGNPSTQYFGFTPRIPAMTVTQQDYPISSFFGYVIDGIFQTDEEAAKAPAQFGVPNLNNKAGQFRFRDLNGDGLINSNDRQVIGNPHPTMSYGLNLNVGYKNFNLTVFGQGVYGNQIFNYNRYWTDFQTFGGIRSKRMWEDSWRPGKTDAKLPQLRSNDNISSNPSTYYLEPGSYLRVKNIQLSYNLPRTLMTKLGVSNAMIYVQGQNLFTVTNYTGLDPEINLRDSGGNGNDRHIGVDEGAYPVAKTVLVGLNLAF